MFRVRSLGLIMATLWSGFAHAEILEERLASGSSVFVPSPFPINPAANATNQTIVAVQQAKRDEHVNFVLDPDNNRVPVDEKIAKKDLAIGGQYPLGGASMGLQYAESRRNVTAKNENSNQQNEELFVNRDYRLSFGVDFTPELRGAFTFHYTALQSDLAGNFNIGTNDRTRYRGTMSGYGLGLYYQLKMLGIGAFSHPPMRGKATVEGEQKIITEPGLYGLGLDFRAAPLVNINFSVTRWSYKHDERDDPSTSPIDQRDIVLRGVDINQFLRKTMAYGLSAEAAVTPLVFVKGQFLKQEAVFLFDPDHLPGDNKDLESRVRYTELKAGVSIKNKGFMAELDALRNSASQGTIKPRSGFGSMGSYKATTTGISLMVGANF